MKNTITHKKYLQKALAEAAEMAAYLNAAVEEGDMKLLLVAIRNVVRAQGGVGTLAKAVKMSRTSLYKTLSPAGNPEVSTLETILAVYNIRIGFFAVPAANNRNPPHRANHGRYLTP